MEFFKILFKLGVVFAIFGFIWMIITLAITLLSGGGSLRYPIRLGLKLVQYVLIANVSILFTQESNWQATPFVVGMILLTFFLGKTQQMNFKMQVLKAGNMKLGQPPKMNMTYEMIVILLALGSYVFFIFNPEFLTSPLIKWFHKTIVDIEKAPIFGFVFQVIGFFVSVSMIMKLVSAIRVLISGKDQQPPNDSSSDSSFFDVYEDITDENKKK